VGHRVASWRFAWAVSVAERPADVTLVAEFERLGAFRYDGGLRFSDLLPSGCQVNARRAFIRTIAGLALASPLARAATQTAKLARVGYLSPNLSASPHLSEAFREGLLDLGYVERRSVVFEYRSADGRIERLPDLAAQLVRLDLLDVIVTGGGTLAALA